MHVKPMQVITEVTLQRCDHRHHLPLPSSADIRHMEERMENGKIKKRKVGTDGKYNENCKIDSERQTDITEK